MEQQPLPKFQQMDWLMKVYGLLGSILWFRQMIAM